MRVKKKRKEVTMSEKLYEIKEVAAKVYIVRVKDTAYGTLTDDMLAEALAELTTKFEVMTTTLFKDFESCVVTVRH